MEGKTFSWRVVGVVSHCKPTKMMSLMEKSFDGQPSSATFVWN